MLGLLLLAGLGVAAAAFVDHVDSSAEDEDTPPEENPEAQGEGDLLDDPAAPEEDTPPEEQAADGATEEDAGSDDGSSAPDDQEAAAPEAFPEGQSDEAPEAQASAAPPAVNKVFGGAGSDSLEGTTGRDLLEGRGGNDTLQGRGGADHLVTFDEGSDRAFGGMGADSLHGYTVNAMPDGDTSFVIEDHTTDRLFGGMGADKLWLGSDDIGAGGAGADEFHVSWDVDHANPATITDYQPNTDRIVVEFTTNRADDAMTGITQADQNLTTEPLEDGSGTAICLNGEPIAHVMGTTALRASDISVVHL
ncbi:hypothetical protein [Stagnihabitans tardus]|uniref:Uncharacterized protein n=1 Tax=Stagnihabitans tardus TaxID=2699202 RepID=A0AAE4YBM0_9RHOB|nr:hypothetical protein [Stagnihabitans tardus]NBZ88391.1 hypothetical protein [Stagnihabitans tardus]